MGILLSHILSEFCVGINKDICNAHVNLGTTSNAHLFYLGINKTQMCEILGDSNMFCDHSNSLFYSLIGK